MDPIRAIEENGAGYLLALDRAAWVATPGSGFGGRSKRVGEMYRRPRYGDGAVAALS